MEFLYLVLGLLVLIYFMNKWGCRSVEGFPTLRDENKDQRDRETCAASLKQAFCGDRRFLWPYDDWWDDIKKDVTERVNQLKVNGQDLTCQELVYNTDIRTCPYSWSTKCGVKCPADAEIVSENGESCGIMGIGGGKKSVCRRERELIPLTE